jgi:2-polyprenyl-3-methyl-5-hydroxy-6-metoxy-1,4-benzoquinol methylase
MNESYFSHSREEILPHVPATIRFALDVGCGGGNFGKLLKQRFTCTVWGVEPDKTSAVQAAEYLDNVLNASFDSNLDLKMQQFDCIFFNDVLEHFVDPGDKLKLAKKLLCNDGHIICSIPNVLYYENVMAIFRTMDWKYEDAGILDETHLRFFTRKSIQRMFRNCGLTITSMNGVKTGYGKKFRTLNSLLLNRLADMEYPQYLVVSSPA